MKKHTVRHLTFAAMMAALTAIITVSPPHIHMPLFGGQGCVHLGDTVIYLGASLLPPWYACTSAALGGSLADLLCGSAVWAPWSFVIKALVALCFTAKGNKILAKRNYFAIIGACLITIICYYIAEAFIYSNWIMPLHSIIGNVIQGVASAILYVVIGLIFDKIHLKKQIHL